MWRIEVSPDTGRRKTFALPPCHRRAHAEIQRGNAFVAARLSQMGVADVIRKIPKFVPQAGVRTWYGRDVTRDSRGIDREAIRGTEKGEAL